MGLRSVNYGLDSVGRSGSDDVSRPLCHGGGVSRTVFRGIPNWKPMAKDNLPWARLEVWIYIAWRRLERSRSCDIRPYDACWAWGRHGCLDREIAYEVAFHNYPIKKLISSLALVKYRKTSWIAELVYE